MLTGFGQEVTNGEISAAKPPLEASVRQSHGQAQLFIAGHPALPMFYSLTDSPAGRWTWEEVPARNLKLFSDIGVKQFCVSIWLEWIWTGPGHLDIDLVRRQIRGVLAVCPDAAIMIRLHVNSPPWWNQQNPDELVRYADGPVADIQPWGMVRPLEGDLERTPRHSLASLKWRRDSGAVVAQLCHELARTPEGNHLVSLQLAAGVFHEWHYYGFIDHEPDTGVAMTAYFRRWLQAKYPDDAALRTAWNNPQVTLESADVPGVVEREHTTDGYFRDPTKERQVIDYYECQHLSVQESAEHFCRIAKENWPRPIVTGVFYGYYFTLFGRMAAGGHLQVQRMLDSPWIDFLSGPQSYRHRNVGQAGISRGLLESARLHGKLWLDEYDTAPDFGLQKDPDPARQLANSVGLERRCLIEPLIHGQGLWFYDFGPRTGHGWWDQPALLDQAKELKTLFTARLSQAPAPVADVLVVMDTDVFYHLGNSLAKDPVTPVAIDDFTEDLFHTGAAIDTVYLFDLERVDLSRYRAVFLPTAFLLTDRQRKFIHDRVAREGRTLIWMSAPGYTNGNRLDVDFVGETTGISVARAADGVPAQVLVDGAGLPSTSFGLAPTPIRPLFSVIDQQAQSMGHLAGTDRVGLARKQLADSTVWFSSVPLRNPDLIRRLLQSAGVHIYQEAGDVTYAGRGLLAIHTLTGGPRLICLRNGRSVSITLHPKSTELLDAETGAILLREINPIVPRGAEN